MDILDLLTQGDPMASQKRQAAALRGQQDFQDMATGANTNANSMNILNFVTANANNPMLAKSVAALTANQQAQNTPQKLDKGVYIPSTGQYQESPGVADEKEADRENRRLQSLSTYLGHTEAANSAADARTYAADQAKEGRILVATLAAESRRASAASSNDFREQRLDLQRQRLSNTVDQANQSDVRNFGHDLKKSGIPDIASAVYGIHDMLNKPEGSIAGIGYGSETLSKIPLLSDMTIGEEGKANRAKVQKLINAVTLTEAGKAVTKNELVRQALVNMSGDRYSEKDFRNAMSTVVLPALESIRSNVLHSSSPSIVDQYEKNDDSGFSPRKSFLPGKGAMKGGSDTLPSVAPMSPYAAREAAPVLDPAVAKKYGL